MKTIRLTINGQERTIEVAPNETLLSALRRLSCTSVRRGCDSGACGACTVLLDGQPVRSCRTRAVAVAGRAVTTVEGLAPPGELDPIQQAFLDAGAVQCGYCTPAYILVTKALLDRNPNPTEEEVREALSGILCRCTGTVRIVQAALRAAAILRGKEVEPFEPLAATLAPDDPADHLLARWEDRSRPLLISPPDLSGLRIVGTPQRKVDGVRLVTGRPAYTDDVRIKDMLYGVLLTSPHAHARILSIDASRALALPGVHAVLTHKDIPRIKFSSGGQSYPQPPPFDQVCLDDKVRHVGDRVAAVAAETEELARRAARLIKVEYEVLPPVLDPQEAMRDGAPVIHDEPDTSGIYDPRRNIVHHIAVSVGDAEAAWARADHIFTGEYRTSKQQQVHIEPHACITYLDEDGRLVVRTSTQVPFHIRRILAPLIGLPVHQIRVIKPRIGGGFGNKQDMILEDLCAHLTLATGRPVRMVTTRRQEFTSTRSRHPQILRFKIGVSHEQEIVAIELYVIGDTGAYAAHGLTVQMVGGQKSLTLYNAPYSRFVCDVVYTNKSPSGAFRGYGAMQGFFGLETLISEIADRMGWDPIPFRRRNWIRVGEGMVMTKPLGEGREGTEQVVHSSGLDRCVEAGAKAVGWAAKRGNETWQSGLGGGRRRGIGMAVMLHGSGVAGLDMASATVKMNDDGSFNLLVGASDLGTGADTILAQIGAEVLAVPLDKIIVYAADTDLTPFDKGAYASSTTYVSGGAVRKAALQVADQIKEHAARMMGLDDAGELVLREGRVLAPDGRSVTLETVALNSLHLDHQHQIAATASHTSPDSPPPFAAQFVEVTVDTETGQVIVDRVVMAVDAGRVVNPTTALGQVEGGIVQGLGFALCEEMVYDQDGRLLTDRLGPYHILKSNEVPRIEVIFVQTEEPTGPFGAKSIAEIPIDGVAPAIADAIHDATGVWIREVPFTPERVWRALSGRPARSA